MGGPYHGQDWVYFSETMVVESLIGNPLKDISYLVSGEYRHDGKGLWVWHGPEVKTLKE